MQPIVIDLETVSIGDVKTYLEPVSAPSNYVDPIKIEAYKAAERSKQIDKASVDLDLARIICVGVKRPDYPTHVLTEREFSEGDMLTWVWELWAQYSMQQPVFVTYGGLGFDIPLLLRRSMYLGVKAPYIGVDRFRHPQVVDLMSVLSMDGKLRWRSLNFYLQRFGYPNGGADITGADVAERCAAGDWAAIESHCRMDVEATAWLAERIGAVPKRQQHPFQNYHDADGVPLKAWAFGEGM